MGRTSVFFSFFQLEKPDKTDATHEDISRRYLLLPISKPSKTRRTIIFHFVSSYINH